MERKMSLKGFLNKANSKAANSANAFLTAHKEFLMTGQLGELTGPILIRLDNRELLPTPALSEIKQLVLGYMIAQQVVSGQPKVRDPKDPNTKASTSTSKPYTGEVYDEFNTVIYSQAFEAHIRAQDWCDRRLVLDAGNGWIGKIIDNCTQRESIVDRDSAFSRMLKVNKPPVSKKTGSGDGKWRMRAVGDHAYFSRG